MTGSEDIMNLTDAQIRSMSTIVKQEDYTTQIGSPDNSRSDMEIISRLILAEENDPEAMVNVAQELWNRRRYRKIFGMGGGLQWRVNGVKDDPRYAGKWREILYADGQYMTRRYTNAFLGSFQSLLKNLGRFNIKREKVR